MRSLGALVLLCVLTLGCAGAAGAQPAGTLTWAVHVTLATRWLDTSETEADITPFMVLYALHDALVKPMPGNLNAPCLAESWTVAKDGRTWEFTLRKGVRFHNGEPGVHCSGNSTHSTPFVRVAFSVSPGVRRTSSAIGPFR